MDENKIKLKVLQDLMSHMRAKDGARLKPKAAAVEVTEMEPADDDVADEAAAGEGKMPPGLQDGADDDGELSEDDLEKLKELYASLQE